MLLFLFSFSKFIYTSLIRNIVQHEFFSAIFLFLGFVAFHGCCCCFQCYKILMSKASSYFSTHFHYTAKLIFSSWYGCSLGQLQTYMDINSLRIKTCFLTSSEFSSFLFFCKFPFIICLSLLVVNLHFMLFMILEIAY